MEYDGWFRDDHLRVGSVHGTAKGVKTEENDANVEPENPYKGNKE